MPQKFSDNKMRTAVDVRPGYNQGTDNRSSNNIDAGAAAHGYPGNPPKPPASERFNSDQANTSIRSVRVGDLGPGFGNGSLGSMELGGRSVTPVKVPPMQKFDSKPITGPGPIEQERLTQQQSNAIAMGDPDYAPMRELDYESIKDANFQPTSKNASKTDKDFTK
jgi:hypothetical protein